MDELDFLSDEWIDALDAAARKRSGAGADDPLAPVSLVIEQHLTDDDRRWRLTVDQGDLRVTRPSTTDGEADVHLHCTAPVARAIAAGTRPALEAFVSGELTIGGDIGALLEHRTALEALGDLFATVADRTRFEG